MKTIIVNASVRIDGLMSEYKNRQYVSFEIAKNLFAKFFPEISSSKELFACVVSFFHLLNKHHMVEDFPEAYTVYLHQFTKKEIGALKERYIEERNNAKATLLKEMQNCVA